MESSDLVKDSAISCKFLGTKNKETSWKFPKDVKYLDKSIIFFRITSDNVWSLKKSVAWLHNVQ